MGELVFKTIGISRLRILNDGDGVTTLAAGYGCPLRCRYCLNPQCFSEKIRVRSYSVEELLDELMVDDLYFKATGGGVVFGGGEPLLYADFIHEFKKKCPSEWKLGLESSLAVGSNELEKVINDIDHFLIDIKDMDPLIYERYTGRSNDTVKKNLGYLADKADPAKVIIRVPLIEGFNTELSRKTSVEELKKLGFINFDLFSYNIEIARTKAEKISDQTIG